MAAADDITDAQVIKTFSFNIKEKRLKKAILYPPNIAFTNFKNILEIHNDKINVCKEPDK